MEITAIIPVFLGLRGAQLIVIVLIVLLLFGAARIPAMMRNLGKGVHSFKQGLEDAKAEMNKPIQKADKTLAEADEDTPKAKIEQHAGAKDVDR